MDPEIARLAADLQREVTRLQTILVTHHGVLRGTFEAAIAEAQGLRMIASNGRELNHAASLEQGIQAVAARQQAISALLRRISALDPKAVNTFSQAVKPLMDLARDRIDLAQRTQHLLFELKFNHHNRLLGTPVATGARNAGGMMSQQLQALSGALRTRGYSLVPSGIGASNAWVQQTVDRIRQLPVDARAASAQVAAAAAMGRVVISRFLANAAASNAWRTLGVILESVFEAGTRVLSIPVPILIPFDKEGHPVGLYSRSVEA
jgi:hypothetical protein